jgi:AcrR family transcriptional regulator
LRNRERILSVAYGAFRDDPDVSLNTIAKLAGVGPGTLYRHFPTRGDLILGLYQHEVQAVVDSVPKVLAEREPLEALRAWFLRLAEYVRLKHGLGEALHSAAGPAGLATGGGIPH